MWNKKLDKSENAGSILNFSQIDLSHATQNYRKYTILHDNFKSECRN